MYIFLFLMILMISGCDFFEPNYLGRAEQLSMEKQRCLVNRVLYHDCDEIDDEIERLELEIKIAERRPRDEQIEAAYEIGKLKANGDASKSTYNQVYDSLANFTPGHKLQLILSGLGGTFGPLRKDFNYLIFTDKCEEFSNKTFYQRYTSIVRFKKADDGSLVSDDVEIFFKRNKNCFNLEDMKSAFVILSEEQIDILNQKNIRALKFESFEMAEQAAEDYRRYESKPVEPYIEPQSPLKQIPESQQVLTEKAPEVDRKKELHCASGKYIYIFKDCDGNLVLLDKPVHRPGFESCGYELIMKRCMEEYKKPKATQ